ncbi:hypothetical protein CRE_15012 [Caenorhabditis remanei]|uniref:F-box domain-containing protein n=1 Tax=Caenorhabditis remanei TaxID=31234 RepID=E3NIP9_CAERE|nr:hypothetical protein CRE_15012 [Caenorhabditis remanei]
MTSPFPLFHIPYVPLGRIIDLMEPKTLVSLSFCSQKSHSVIKTQRKLSFDGHLLVGESHQNASFLSFTNFVCWIVPKSNNVLIARKFEENINYEGMESVKMGGQHVRVKMDQSHGYIISYWKNTTEGSKVISEYITNLFNIDVSDIWASNQSFHMIEWVNRRQKTPLKNVSWSATTSSEEDMIYFLKDYRPISQLRIYVKPPPNFRFFEKFRKIDCLDIWYGEWVTIDNLLTMDGIDIVLESSTLTSTNLNVFLKHWLSGGVLDGLLHNAVFVENSRNYTSPFGNSRTLSFGYDIQRADGVTATVCKQENETLVIAVWPETTHNYN